MHFRRPGLCSTKSCALQVNVTARDRYGNTIPTGDSGFDFTAPLTDAIVSGSLERSVSNGVTHLAFSIESAGQYVVRVEDASQRLVHRSKLTILPAGLSYAESNFIGLSAATVAGQPVVWTMQVRPDITT